MKTSFSIPSFPNAAALFLAVGLIACPVALSAAGGKAAGGGAVGGGSGGGVTVAPVPTGPALASVKIIAGYRPHGAAAAAIWSSFSVVNVDLTMRVRLRITDETGIVVWDARYMPGTQTIDDDWVAFSTIFLVDVELYDGSGKLVDARHTVVTTPAPKLGTTAG